MHQFNARPLDKVWLRNGFHSESVQDRQTIRYDRIHELVQTLFASVVLKPASLNRFEIAYLRRSLGMSQASLASVLGVTEQSVSLWERGAHQLTQGIDTLLRKFCVEQRRRAFFGRTKDTTISSLAPLAKKHAEFIYVGTYDGGWRFELDIVRQQAATPEVLTNLELEPLYSVAIEYHQNPTRFIRQATAMQRPTVHTGTDILESPVPLHISTHAYGNA